MNIARAKDPRTRFISFSDVLGFFNHRPKLVILLLTFLFGSAIWSWWWAKGNPVDAAIMFLSCVLIAPAVFAGDYLIHHARTREWVLSDDGIRTGTEILKWCDVSEWKISAIDEHPDFFFLEVFSKQKGRAYKIVLGENVDHSSLGSLFERYLANARDRL